MSYDSALHVLFQYSAEENRYTTAAQSLESVRYSLRNVILLFSKDALK